MQSLEDEVRTATQMMTETINAGRWRQGWLEKFRWVSIFLKYSLIFFLCASVDHLAHPTLVVPF